MRNVGLVLAILGIVVMLGAFFAYRGQSERAAFAATMIRLDAGSRTLDPWFPQRESPTWRDQLNAAEAGQGNAVVAAVLGGAMAATGFALLIAAKPASTS